VRLAYDDGDLRHGGLRYGGDHLGAVADDPLALDGGADHEAGDVGQKEQRDIERVAEPDEAASLIRRDDKEDTPLVHRLVGQHADNPSIDPREAADDLLRKEGLDLEEAAGIDHPVDQLL